MTDKTQEELNEELIDKVSEGNLAACEFLLGIGGPLHLAAGGGYADICAFLLSKGACVNLRDKYGRTPLHLAARNGYTDICELLLSKGADLTLRDRHGNTPLSLAISEGQIETIELLRKHGGSV